MAATGKQTDVDRELKRLRALIAQQQERLSALEGQQLSEPEADNGNGDRKPRSTRRQLLKLAGAAMVGAAGSAALRALPAAAAQGDTLTVGTMAVQDANNDTGVMVTGTAQPESVFKADGTTGTLDSINGLKGWAPNYGAGVVGRATTFAGVYGYTEAAGTGTGVWGFTKTGYAGVEGGGGSTGVFGYTYGTGRRAIYGYTSATNSVAGYFLSKTNGASAVHAYSMNDFGVVGGTAGVAINAGPPAAGVMGVSYSNATAMIALNLGGQFPDLKLGGSGRLLQVPTTTGGPAQAPNYTPMGSVGYFEIVRDGAGAIWADRGQGNGAAAWKRINAVRTDAASGNGNAFPPFRLVDTRFGTGGQGGAKSDSSTTTWAAAPSGSGDSTIPADAIAVVGNLTAVGNGGTLGPGFLTIFPAGVARPGTSSVNFQVGQAAIANSFIVGLGTGGSAGKLSVFVSAPNGPVHIVVDITGYVQ